MTGSSRPSTAPVSQTTTTNPWSGAVPAMTTALNAAQTTFAGGAPQYFQGSTIAPMSSQTLAGMEGIQQNAQLAAPLANQGTNFLGSVMNQGPTAGQGFASTVAGGGAQNPFLGSIAGQTNGQNPFMGAMALAGASGNTGLAALNPFLSGGAQNPFAAQIAQAGGQSASGIGTQTLSTAAGGGFLQNPFLDAAVGRAQNTVRDNTNTLFAQGGRYGSQAHQGTLQSGVGDVASQMYGQAYESDMANRMGAAGQLAGYENAGLDRNMQALTQAGQFGESALGRQYDASTLMPAYFEQGANRAMQGFGAESDSWNASRGLNLQAMGLGTDAYGQNLSQALDAYRAVAGQSNAQAGLGMQAVGMLPGMYDFANAGNNDMMNIGTQLENFDQANIDANRQRWDYEQNAQRANIEWLNAIATGQGSLASGSNSIGMQPYTRGSGASTAAGYASALASLFSISDPAMKTDVRYVGQSPGGLPIYDYRFIGTDIVQRGVMADEVPAAFVARDLRSGVRMVDYAGLADAGLI